MGLIFIRLYASFTQFHTLPRATTGVYYEPYGICNGLLFKDFVKGGFHVCAINERNDAVFCLPCFLPIPFSL